MLAISFPIMKIGKYKMSYACYLHRIVYNIFNKAKWKKKSWHKLSETLFLYLVKVTNNELKCNFKVIFQQSLPITVWAYHFSS